MQRTITTHARTAVLRDAIAVMQADYAADLAIDDVARRIATSRRQLQRCFAEHGDGSFRRSLTRIRMERAAELLTETSLTVREVAARVGYRQQAHFAKAFAREFGMAPMQLRRSRRFAVAG